MVLRSPPQIVEMRGTAPLWSDAMFGMFKSNPVAKLEKQYAKLLEQARDIQRNGDVVAASAKTAEAEAIRVRIEEIEEQQRATAS